MFRKSVLPFALGAMFFTAPLDTQQSGARWLAFQGCWRPVDSAMIAAAVATPQIVCIVPGSNLSSAQFATIDSGRVVQRTQIAATGEAIPRSEGGCVGTERASWSANGERVYLRVEQTCEGGNKRSASSVITILADNEWLNVQAVTVAGQKSVRVVRYAEVQDLSEVPAEITSALGSNSMAARAARIAASAPVTSADVIDASKNVDGATVEAWMVEAHQEINIDGKELLRLSKAGVSPAVTDLLVALAYPEVFSVDHSAQPVQNAQQTAGYGSGVMYNDYYDPFYYDPFSRYDPYYRGGMYRSSYFSPYGYNRYGNRYYSNYTPVIIIVRDGSTVGQPPAEPHGRVVNGQGYTRGGSGASTNTVSGGSSKTTGSSTSGSSGSSGSGSSSTGSTSGGSSSSGSTGRTAIPRTTKPPP